MKILKFNKMEILKNIKKFFKNSKNKPKIAKKLKNGAKINKKLFFFEIF